MWRLLRSPTHTYTSVRQCMILKIRNISESKIPISVKSFLTNTTSNSHVMRYGQLFKLSGNVVVGSSMIGYYFYVKRSKVFCEAQRNRLEGYNQSTRRHSNFDWKLFWTYLKPYIWHFLAAVVGALLVALLNIQIPQSMGSLIDVIAKYSSTKDSEMFMSEIKSPAVKLIAMYVGQSACTFFYIYMLSNLGERMAFKLRTDLFSSVIKQNISFFDGHRTGEIINRLTSDVQDFKSSFKQIVSGGLRAVTQIVGSTVALVTISPKMTFVTLLCVPSIIAVGTIFGALLRATSRKAQAQLEKTTAVADEAIGNVRTVRAFAMEDQEKEMYEREAELAMIYNENLGFGIGLFQAATNMFLNSMVLGTMYMGGYLLSTNQLSAGDMMAYLMASQTIQRSLGQISLLFGSVVRGIAAGTRIFEYIKMEPTIPLRGGKIIPENYLKGQIVYNDVTFAYPTRWQQPILQGFNLTVPSGKTVAIVGASGNGKSTVVALLERFYDVDGGYIAIDGHDIRTIDPSWMRTRVLGLISQEPVLFATSISENIRYGKPDATDEEVRNAAKLANADEFISNFPKGYDTLVGERGATLSGGQKQRIAIARALIKDPKVLLLDEATSALDAESEKVVQAALDKATEGRTVIIIAHRLSTIQNADLIVVLNKGKIVEMGTPEQLQKLETGYYKSLMYQQQAASGA